MREKIEAIRYSAELKSILEGRDVTHDRTPYWINNCFLSTERRETYSSSSSSDLFRWILKPINIHFIMNSSWAF